ncbi:MAG: hypothetical protein QGF56_05075 [Verrucomicrobiota bacterium]|nr:hypothetical protein [Verrucomicrobiota bacterium]MDP6753040.1 hypothetical protein [Verrucomicrobiota bacterium]
MASIPNPTAMFQLNSTFFMAAWPSAGRQLARQRQSNPPDRRLKRRIFHAKRLAKRTVLA